MKKFNKEKVEAFIAKRERKAARNKITPTEVKPITPTKVTQVPKKSVKDQVFEACSAMDNPTKVKLEEVLPHIKPNSIATNLTKWRRMQSDDELPKGEEV